MRTLPQYWCVKNDGTTSLFKNSVVEYLNRTYRSSYNGNSLAFYGYGGDSNDSSCSSDISSFPKRPVILTLEEFLSYFEPSDFPKIPVELFKKKANINSFIINVPKL